MSMYFEKCLSRSDTCWHMLLSPGAGGCTWCAERGIGHDTSIPGWKKEWENGWQSVTSSVIWLQDAFLTKLLVRKWWQNEGDTVLHNRNSAGARVTLISSRRRVPFASEKLQAKCYILPKCRLRIWKISFDSCLSYYYLRHVTVE